MGIHDGHRERKRRQFVQGGDAFPDHELLELLLCYAIPRQNTNPLAHELIDRFGSLRGVVTAPVEELTGIKGVGMNTAVLLSLVGRILCRVQQRRTAQGMLLDTTERQGAFFQKLFESEEREAVYLLCLNAEGRRLGLRRLCGGDIASAAPGMREIVENALRCGAVAVVLAHNHPSGLALPSEADLAATQMIQSVLTPLNIRLTDHIIVAGDDFVSLRQSGHL